MVIYLVAPPSGFLLCFLDEKILLEGLSTIQQAKSCFTPCQKSQVWRPKSDGRTWGYRGGTPLDVDVSHYLFFHLILRLRWVDLELPGPFSQAIKASAPGVSKVLIMPHLQLGSWCFFMVTPPTAKQNATNYQTIHPNHDPKYIPINPN